MEAIVINKRDFNRRAFIRGAGGVMIALPVAHFVSNGEKLIGAPALALDAPRLFTLSWGTGAPPEQFNFNGLLKSFLGLKDQVLLIQNMSNPGAIESSRKAVNTHVAGAMAAFTGTTSKLVNESLGSNKGHIPSSASIDQIAYAKFKPNTKLSVIQTGYSGFVDQPGFGDFLDYRSFDSQGKHLDQILNDPYKLFTALFGAGSTTISDMDADEIAKKVRRQSVLDGVIQQIKGLNSDRYGLSSDSRTQLNEHLEKVRELEKSAGSMAVNTCKIPMSSITKEKGLSYARNTQTLKEMMEIIGTLMVTAFQCDLVRYGNICIGESAFHCRIDSLLKGAQTDGHEAAHTPALVPIWVEFARYYLDIVANIMTKMQQAVDVDGKSLLDNSIFYVATEMSDHSNNHSFANMPALVIGGKPHGVPTGNVIDAKQAPIADALAAVLTSAKVPTESIAPFGKSRLF
jgi:hypothetical protein